MFSLLLYPLLLARRSTRGRFPLAGVTLLLALILLPLVHDAWALSSEPRLISWGDGGGVIEIGTDGFQLRPVSSREIGGQEALLPGAVWMPRPGYPAVPVRGVLVAIPPGASVRLVVEDAVYEELEGVDLMPVPQGDVMGRDDAQWLRPASRRNDEAYGIDAFYPAEAAVLAETAVIRDQTVASISLRPIQYNPVRRTLRRALRMRVRVVIQLDPAAQRAVRPGATELDVFAKSYKASILNAVAAPRLRGRSVGAAAGAAAAKQAGEWFLPGEPYTRIAISEDGVYRLDADWFEATGLVLGPGDLDRLKLYVDGEEQPLKVDDGGDGTLDADESVTFVGRFRRTEDRNFESEYGAENAYWLTTAGGLRQATAAVDARPVSGFPDAERFTSRAHAEVDSLYDPLGLSGDADRDHWYWIRMGSPLGAIPEFPFTRTLSLPGMDADSLATVQIQVGLHGLTTREAFSPDHRASILLQDGTVVADGTWDGQEAFTLTGTVPALGLGDSLEVTVSLPGSSSFPGTYVDNALMNWVSVRYPRSTTAVDGILAFDPGSAGEGRTLRVDGFRDADITIFDMDRRQVLTPEVVAVGGAFEARFEVGDASGVFVAADRSAIRTPGLGTLFEGSRAAVDLSGADYVVITHPEFRTEAERLAAHREVGGLVTRVVDVADVYGAFSYGQMDPEAIQDYVRFAFETWDRRPTYVLLFGRASYDYRDLFGQASTGRRNLVPALPMFVTKRGLAYTDHFYATVAGDDAFPDLYVGRLSVTSLAEAAAAVDKVVGYDSLPDAVWRNRILYMANIDEFFVGPSDSMAARYSEPAGMETFRVHQTVDPDPEPNGNTARVIDQWNEGRALVNFMGHGSAAIMSTFIRGTSQQGNYNYIVRLENGERLPMVIAMSCLNGLFAEPRITSLAEEMLNKRDGGAIAYASASSLAFVFSNAQLNDAMIRRIFEDDMHQFGQSLMQAKIDLLTSFPGLERSAFAMNLLGDPAQALALPTGPDYAISDADVVVLAEEPLVAEDTLLVRVRLKNQGIVGPDNVPVILTDVDVDRGTIDTLFVASLTPFGHADSVTVSWPVRGRAGAHRLVFEVDSENRVAEWDETNNRAEVDLELFGALTAVVTVPVDGQAMVPGSVRFGIRAGVTTASGLAGSFEISETGLFDGAGMIRSGQVNGDDGFVLWEPSGLTEGTYTWRARLSDGGELGPWTDPQTLTVTSASAPRGVRWQQNGAQAFAGEAEDVEVVDGDRLSRVDEPPPMRFTAETRIDLFPATNVEGTAVLATDGTHLFVKGFYSDPRIYPGNDLFRRVGSGFGGTMQGEDLGNLADVPAPGISAAFHGDGYLYAEHGDHEALTRISAATGAVDTVSVPDGLLEVDTGLMIDGRFLITSDGALVYNVAWGINGVRRAGWLVRVFDPADGWRLVREYEVEPTSTGFTYTYTDGAIADGRYLYLVEFSTGVTHRVRVVDAVDGHFVTEFESDQMETDLLSGQYDPVNNRVWFGQLEGNGIISYRGRTLPAFGTVTTRPIGPATAWGLLTALLEGVGGSASAELDVLGETATGSYLPIDGWMSLDPSQPVDLSPIRNARLKLRLRLTGEDLGPSPRLAQWSVDYEPVSDIVLRLLTAVPLEAEELASVTLNVTVANLGPVDRAFGTTVAFYASPEVPSASAATPGRLIGRVSVPELTELGVSRTLSFLWDTATFAGEHRVTARVEDTSGKPSVLDRRLTMPQTVTVQSSGDTDPPLVTIVAVDALGDVREGDFLPAETAFQIVLTDASGIDPQSFEMVVEEARGERRLSLGSPILEEESRTDTSLALRAELSFEDGRVSLSASGEDRLGNGPGTKAVAFQVASDLAIERVLNVPNPMSLETTFTYLLSRPADVKIHIYTVAGRLVQRFEDLAGKAGYNQVTWNGLDGDGHALANGVYLYTVSADDGETVVRVKEKLMVYR